MLEKQKFLSQGEKKQLLSYWNSMRKVGGRRNIQRWLLINVALGTGCRVSELCDLEPNDIDFGEFPNVNIMTKKGGDRNTVYISNKLASDLKWYLKHHHRGKYLFCTDVLLSE